MVCDEADDHTDAACFCFVEFDIGRSIRLCRGVTPSPTVEGGGVDEVDRTRFILAFVWESRNAEYLPSLLSSLSLKLGVSFLLDRPDGAAFALEAVLVALLSVAGKGAGAGPVTESAVVELTDRDGAAFALEALLVALLPVAGNDTGTGPVTEAAGAAVVEWTDFDCAAFAVEALPALLLVPGTAAWSVTAAAAGAAAAA